MAGTKPHPGRPFPPDSIIAIGRENSRDTPMKRPAQPEEIAPAFVFFASNADSSNPEPGTGTPVPRP